MGKDTHIQWCDSTINLQMGCEGCELVNGQEVVKCYAKILTDRYAGRNGWPEAFEKPKIFMDRLYKCFGNFFRSFGKFFRSFGKWINNRNHTI